MVSSPGQHAQARESACVFGYGAIACNSFFCAVAGKILLIALRACDNGHKALCPLSQASQARARSRATQGRNDHLSQEHGVSLSAEQFTGARDGQYFGTVDALWTLT